MNSKLSKQKGLSCFKCGDSVKVKKVIKNPPIFQYPCLTCKKIYEATPVKKGEWAYWPIDTYKYKDNEQK